VLNELTAFQANLARDRAAPPRIRSIF
jgi:hypothetical protein